MQRVLKLYMYERLLVTLRIGWAFCNFACACVFHSNNNINNNFSIKIWQDRGCGSY